MRPSTYKALLVIADISGFTQFMKLHQNAFSHARHVVVELLKSIIAASSPPLKLAELEGDAVFFYAACEDGELEHSLAAVKAQVIEFFRSFYQALQRLCELPLGEGETYADAQNLRLKIVMHLGEVAIEKIRPFEKLFGIDVILVHRLLKNSVPSNEYVLMTEAVYNRLDDFYQMKPERHEVDCDDIGMVNAVVFYPDAVRLPNGSAWLKPVPETDNSNYLFAS